VLLQKEPAIPDDDVKVELAAENISLHWSCVILKNPTCFGLQRNNIELYKNIKIHK
jgi:hypothetical protein